MFIGIELLTKSLKSLLTPLALRAKLINLEVAINAAFLESWTQQKFWGKIDDFHSLQQANVLRDASIASLFMIANTDDPE